MNVEIYYFSGTGNSFSVARDIAGTIGGKLIPIASLAERNVISISADVMGIVFPVYYTDMPVIIREFAGKLDNIGNTYMFSACTYGGGTGDTLKNLGQIIRSRGGRLSAMFGVHMPQNGFSKPFENPPVLYRSWKRKLSSVSGHILQQKTGMLLSDFLSYLLLYPVQLVAKSAFRKYLARIGGTPGKSNEDLIRLLDKNFETDEKCDGCGTCARLCPVNNIRIADHKPVWMHHCETCLACYHWCPRKAIRGGIAPSNGYHYQHPDVRISDIMKQKKTD